LRLLWFFLGLEVKSRVRQSVTRRLKRQGLLVYLRSVESARKIFLACLLGFFLLQLVVVAGVGAVVTGLWLWDYDLHAKLQLVFGLCLACFVLPVLLLGIAFSERLWYRFSGSEKMVADLLDKKDAA
jgi:hypothetical protein